MLTGDKLAPWGLLSASSLRYAGLPLPQSQSVAAPHLCLLINRGVHYLNCDGCHVNPWPHDQAHDVLRGSVKEL